MMFNLSCVNILLLYAIDLFKETQNYKYLYKLRHIFIG